MQSSYPPITDEETDGQGGEGLSQLMRVKARISN